MVEEIASKGNVSVIKFNGSLIKITIGDIEKEVDLDVLSKIDLNYLIGEIITTPVVVNRWGNILAEVQRQFQISKLDFEIFCAKQKEEIRNKAVSDGAQKKLTIAEVDDALTLSDKYKVLKTKIIESEKVVDIVNSTFWALKDKSDKLNKLSLTIQREDVENYKQMITNGIKVVIKKSRIVEEE